MSYFTDRFDEKVTELLKGGAAGFMPSDTVYGLSACALNQAAVEKLYHLKQRDDHKPCIVLIADVDQAGDLGVDVKELEPVGRFWPAPLTFIAPAENAPRYLHRGTKTLAIRIPDNNKLRDLIDKTGPLVSTSANIQNEPVALTAQRAQEIFGDSLDFYIDGGVQSGQSSTIVKISGGKLEIVRQGAWKMPL